MAGHYTVDETANLTGLSTQTLRKYTSCGMADLVEAKIPTSIASLITESAFTSRLAAWRASEPAHITSPNNPSRHRARNSAS